MITSYWLLDILLVAIFIYLSILVLAWALQSRFIFFPTIEKKEFSYKMATPSEEFEVHTRRRATINCLEIFNEVPRGIILYLHGNTGSIRRWRFMGEELSLYGFNVIIPDYRGYGKSKGRRSEKNMHEDMKDCLEVIIEKYPDLPIIIYGRSLGSGFAVPLALDRRIAGLVLETPFYSLLDVAGSYFPLLPMKFLLRYPFHSEKYITKINAPIIILHGTKDRIVPHSSALKLYQLIKEKPEASMVTIQGGKHNNLNSYPLFREKLREFLEGIKKVRE